MLFLIQDFIHHEHSISHYEKKIWPKLQFTQCPPYSKRQHMSGVQSLLIWFWSFGANVVKKFGEAQNFGLCSFTYSPQTLLCGFLTLCDTLLSIKKLNNDHLEEGGLTQCLKAELDVRMD